MKKQKKQGVVSVFAVKGEKQGLGQGARYVAESPDAPESPDATKSPNAPDNPDAPEALEMLKIVVGDG